MDEGIGLTPVKGEGEWRDYNTGEIVEPPIPDPNYESWLCEFWYNRKEKIDPDKFKKLLDIFDEIQGTSAYIAALHDKRWTDDETNSFKNAHSKSTLKLFDGGYTSTFSGEPLKGEEHD